MNFKAAYRIHKTRYAGDSGEGARRYGGRWNPTGVAVIYAASHVSLAALDTLGKDSCWVVTLAAMSGLLVILAQLGNCVLGL
jgi:RES domain-containing protein